MRQGGRRESMFLNVNQWISMQLIRDIKRCSQIMQDIQVRKRADEAALLNSGMTDVERQSSVFQAMLDDYSEIDMNVIYGWTLHSCSLTCMVDHKHSFIKFLSQTFLICSIKPQYSR